QGQDNEHRSHGAELTAFSRAGTLSAMIDHIGINISDLARSKAFYTKALAPLGYTLVMDLAQFNVAGFGIAPKPDFWISGRTDEKIDTVHVAFRAKGRAEVRAFYEAALAAGGKDNGPPGIRAQYHPD